MIDGTHTSTEWQVADTPICVLPIGSFEQHADHLPLDTDSMIAEHIARQVARELDAALLPTIHIATSLEHHGYRGSITLRPETLMQIVRDLADEVQDQGFTILIVINGHGGNHCLTPVIRDINRQDRPLKILLVQPSAFAAPGIADEGRARGVEFHAGEYETSVMLAIRPDLVRGSRSDTPPRPDEPHPLQQPDLTTFGIGQFSVNGAVGYPSLASADKGEAILASIRSGLIDHLRDRMARLRQQPRYAGASGVALRALTERDVPAGMRLKTLAGWNQTEADWLLFIRSRPEGCFAAVHNGRVVGTVTTTGYGWIGMLLVDPETRRMGIGSRLLGRAIESLAGVPAIRLDATPQGLPLYARHGFHIHLTLHRWVRERCPPCSDREANPFISPLQEGELAEAIALDRRAFGSDRSALIRSLWERAPDLAWRQVHDGRLVGLCLGRRGSHTVQIGPVIARGTEDAAALCQACLRSLRGQVVVMDVPEEPASLAPWLQEQGFLRQRSLTRMGLAPAEIADQDPAQGRMFAIAGPEWG